MVSEMISPTRNARRAPFVALVALALLLPVGARAQGPRFLTDTLAPGDPIGILLERAAELRLTPEQVTRLQGIQRQLHAANDTLVVQLVALRHQVWGQGAVHPRDMTPEQRAAFRAAAQRARPLMDSIARNNVQAMEEVGRALSSEQKEQVRAWLGEQRSPGQRLKASPGARGRPGPGPRPGRGVAGRGPRGAR